jgi:hypothetical protein
MSQIDWAKEGKNDYTVYPEGTYKVSITGYEQVTASTGTLQIRWRSTIMEPAEFIGKPITMHTPLTEKSLWKIARLVKACGIDIVSLGKMEIGSSAFLKVLESCIRRTTYWHLLQVPDNKGNPRNEVDDFRADSEQQPISVTNEDDIPPFLKE